MEQTNELKAQLKQALLSLASLESKLRESENLNLGLIAENNSLTKLVSILRTRGKDANQDQEDQEPTA